MQVMSGEQVCPITLLHVNELRHPVVIRAYPAQPYELTPLWKWVLKHNRHPLTGQPCSLSDIVPLHGRSECDTEAVLEGLNLTSMDALVIKQDLKEMDENVHRLEEALTRIHREIAYVTGEKVQLKMRLKNMKTEYFGTEQSSMCVIC
jgi:hypothetical protein